jgi:chromosome segregation ATPase
VRAAQAALDAADGELERATFRVETLRAGVTDAERALADARKQVDQARRELAAARTRRDQLRRELDRARG